MQQSLLLKPDPDVTGETRLGRTKVYELIANGTIPSIRIGHSVRVPRAALEAWIKAQDSNSRAE